MMKRVSIAYLINENRFKLVDFGIFLTHSLVEFIFGRIDYLAIYFKFDGILSWLICLYWLVQNAF